MIFALPVCFHFSKHPDLSCGILMLDDVKKKPFKGLDIKTNYL